MIRCVFGAMKRCLMLLICLMRATLPIRADLFKISLCRLSQAENFNFFIENLKDKSCVSGCFIDGAPRTDSVSEDAEITEESEHRVCFDISGRSFIVEDDGTVTIVNENADDRFCVYMVAQKPFPRPILVHNRERQLEYAPFTSENWKKTDESGFELVETDALREKWSEKWREEYEKTNNAFIKDDGDSPHGSCNVF